MSTGPEYEEVEQPFITQLNQMGWRYTTGNPGDPSVTQRETFREVLLRDDLERALRRINVDPGGEPWLDDHRVTQATHALERLGAAKLLEANQKATELLYKGTTVDGVEGWDKGRARTVHFIDWQRPENNTFRAINQFRVACPAGQGHGHIDPDIVLFVNGIPLVVVECKSPYVPSALEGAIDQLQRYANRRKDQGRVDCDEGNERLFQYGQFQIVTSGEEARVGTFSALANHYLEWKDTSPRPMAEVAAELDKDVEALTSQEKLVAGMLRPAHLLDIVRHFTLFAELGGRLVKIVARYQQFRAVQLAVRRLKTGKTRPEDGEQDRRGGIIWHTQGSGKSLTMVFLIRKMRSDPELRRFKVVAVTDRRDLEDQLSETAEMTGENLTIVKREQRGQRSVSSYEVLQETLARPGKDLVFATIQKYRGELIDADEPDSEDDDEEEGEARRPVKTKPMPVLNEDTDILVLVDEAHRSHTNTAHANLMRALPNCAKIGFTGTPILMGAKKRTHEIFGAFIDKYTIRQAEADEAIVPILYEGRTAGAEVEGGGKLDDLFEDMLADRSPEEMEAIKAKYATKGRVMEAKALIAAKARSMLRHYVEHILPNGYKAQVVAVSRRATVRYYEAFEAARAELVEELEGLDPTLLELADDQVARLEGEQAFRVRAHRFLATVRRLEFAPVISGTHNDTVDPRGEWTSRSRIKARIERFKKPLVHEDPDKADPLAFLIVKSMLLTGFDAPVEQAMYLDRHIQQAELLQAVARVNRTHTLGGVEKKHGIVIDYYGVAQHLKEALAAYSAEDVEGALQSLKDEMPKLRDRHRRAVQVFTTRGIEDIEDVEACVQLLRDERIRAEFHVALKDFLQTLDTVLPQRGLEHTNDAKTLSHIQMKAQKRYRSDEPLIGKDVGAKVRKLIDGHVISKGIDPRIPPVAITDGAFEREVDKQGSPRARASEMEHALRYHIRKHFDEDPTHFEKLSRRLEDVLRDLEGRWNDAAEALQELVEEARKGRQRDDTGLDPETQAPFYALLKEEMVGDGALDPEAVKALCDLTVELVDHVRQELAIVGFWDRPQARDALRSAIFMRLDDADILPFDRLDEAADKLMELARANHRRLSR